MSAPMPLEVGSDDIDEVYAAIRSAEKRCAEAEAALDASEGLAEDEFDAACKVLLALENRLLELESEAAATETRELRRDYWQMAI